MGRAPSIHPPRLPPRWPPHPYLFLLCSPLHSLAAGIGVPLAGTADAGVVPSSCRRRRPPPAPTPDSSRPPRPASRRCLGSLAAPGRPGRHSGGRCHHRRVGGAPAAGVHCRVRPPSPAVVTHSLRGNAAPPPPPPPPAPPYPTVALCPPSPPPSPPRPSHPYQTGAPAAGVLRPLCAAQPLRATPTPPCGGRANTWERGEWTRAGAGAGAPPPRRASRAPAPRFGGRVYLATPRRRLPLQRQRVTSCASPPPPTPLPPLPLPPPLSTRCR